jgi:hypothetical protein
MMTAALKHVALRRSSDILPRGAASGFSGPRKSANPSGPQFMSLFWGHMAAGARS